MEQKVLAAELRDNTGKGASRKLRMAGKIPAIVYGAGEPVKVSIDSREFGTSFKEIHENEIIDLKVGKKDHQVFIKDYQKNILSGAIGHIDFYEIEKGKLLKTHVPIHFTGNPVGVREGGILEHKVEEFEVECLPKDMPEQIEIDLSNLALGDTLHVSDIPSIKGVKFLTSSDLTVAVVSHAKSEVVETADEDEEVSEEAAGE